MKMWMLNPKILCRQHLLGEHNELHKHRHIFVKQRKIDGYIKNNCIQPSAMEVRHHSLVREMLHRGYKHKSPYELPDLSYLPKEQMLYQVNIDDSLETLLNRCGECTARYFKLMEVIWKN